mgnify:CR=1 FL=1
MVTPNQIINADNVETLRGFPDDCIDSIVTDPPYGLSFMGKRWDYDVPSVELWQECLRVLKPGGHLLAFAGTRTQHRMAVRIEDAGFEIRDMIAWVYGSGFPKSLDVSKAIDKAAGVAFSARPASGVGFMGLDGPGGYNATKNQLTRDGESTEAAKQWQGWGTALKPSLEPITVARKPLVGTVAENVLQHGTGALNVDGCRVETTENLGGGAYAKNPTARDQMWGAEAGNSYVRGGAGEFVQPAGRWPANLIHDGSDEVVQLFPEADGGSFPKVQNTKGTGRAFGDSFTGAISPARKMNDSGSAARFFYCAKADASERRSSKHPTVKPVALMRYLVRLVTPVGGIVLDPFGGSGSTAEAARLESCRYILIEREADYCRDAAERLRQGVLF